MSATPTAPAPGASHLLRQSLYQLAGMDFSGEVFGYSCDKGDFAVFGRAQGEHTGTQFVPQAIHKLSQSFAINILHFLGNDLDALDGLGFSDQLIQLAQRAFALLRFQIFLERLYGL